VKPQLIQLINSTRVAERAELTKEKEFGEKKMQGRMKW